MGDTQISQFSQAGRSNMSKARRSYTNDYKVAAVKLVTEKGLSCAEAGRRWVSIPIPYIGGMRNSRPKVRTPFQGTASFHPWKRKTSGSGQRTGAC